MLCPGGREEQGCHMPSRHSKNGEGLVQMSFNPSDDLLSLLLFHGKELRLREARCRGQHLTSR